MAWARTEVQQTLAFLPSTQTPKKTIAFTLSGASRGGGWRKTLVIFHGALISDTLTLPPGNWKLTLDGNGESSAGAAIVADVLTLAPLSAYVLYQE